MAPPNEKTSATVVAILRALVIVAILTPPIYLVIALSYLDKISFSLLPKFKSTPIIWVHISTAKSYL